LEEIGRRPSGKINKWGCLSTISWIVLGILAILFLTRKIEIVPDSPTSWPTRLDNVIPILLFILFPFLFRGVDIKKWIKILVATVLTIFGLAVGTTYLFSPIDLVPDPIPMPASGRNYPALDNEEDE
jgi:uncharacterized BrkB/YihY/UPF0761 family membrane protein